MKEENQNGKERQMAEEQIDFRTLLFKYIIHFRFQWMWEDGYNNNLVLDYGRAGISYMDDVFVTGNRFRGTFHLSADSPGFDFVLEME